MLLFDNTTKNATISLNLVNGTTSQYDPVAASLTWFTLFCCIAALSLNALITVVYLKDRAVRSVPFHAYLMNLAFAEILLAAAGMTGQFVNGYLGGWQSNLVYCSFVTLSNQILGSAVRYAHLQITVSRFWAATFPLGFKKHNTQKLVFAVIATTWCCVLLLHLPLFAWGRQWALPNEKRCTTKLADAFLTMITIEILGFTTPEVWTLVMYIFIVYKLRQGATGIQHSLASIELPQIPNSANGKRLFDAQANRVVVSMVRNPDTATLDQFSCEGSGKRSEVRHKKKRDADRVLQYLVGAMIPLENLD
ncbi:alpha-2C adrenergic receptor-like [Paramacrobiotus metropolitanus]|uniref:alpha-2C adrenergic receptor-like n=1 Tax=Paramacrobiotus metropolitanus TaxID=2943436 RepID=UPI002445657E|nr:alpha-2C adrenergic receptor-like [Paramacrobiotus metropolitanus]